MATDRLMVEAFLDAVAGERVASENTVETYEDALGLFLGWLEGRRLRLRDVSYDDIVSYAGWLGSRYAEATVMNRLSVMRGLFRFLAAEGMIPSDPTIHMQPVRQGRPLPYVLSLEDVERLLTHVARAAADTSASPFMQASLARRAAVIEVLYASGMRVSEAVALPATVLARNERYLLVSGKGGKERIVPLHEKAIEAARLWRSRAAAYGVASRKWLFHSVRDGARPLTRQAAYKDIQQAAAEAGVRHADKVTPHVLRHCFATHLLSNGADLRAIQILLGHADLGTTEIYTHVEQSRAFAMVNDLHPLAEGASD